MRRFWYFDVSVWSLVRWKKLCLLGLCQISVLAHCKDSEPRYPPNTSKRLRFPWIPLRYPQTPPHIPQTPPQTSPGSTTCKQTTTDANWHRQTYSNSNCQCPGVSGSVCSRLLACCVPWRCLGCVCGVCGGVRGYLSGIHGNHSRLDVFGWELGSQPLQYGAKTLFWHNPKKHNFFHLMILGHQNTKTAAYQLSRIFGVFRFAGEKSFVTVAFDPPCCLSPKDVIAKNITCILGLDQSRGGEGQQVDIFST